MKREQANPCRVEARKAEGVRFGEDVIMRVRQGILWQGSGCFSCVSEKSIVWGQKNSLESECKTNKTSRKRKRNQLQTGLFGDSLSWADTLTLAKGLRASEQCFALYPLSAGKHSYDS